MLKSENDTSVTAETDILSRYFELKKVLTCSICLGYFDKPSIHVQCGQAFCTECINKALGARKCCPICNAECNLSDIIPSPWQNTSRILAFMFSIDQRLEVKPATNNNASNPSITEDGRSRTGPKLLPQPIMPKPIEVSVRVFRQGEIVNVFPRTWIGINKPGGIAWVTNIHVEDSSYDVKYIVDSRHDYHVPAIFVSEHEDLDRHSRRRSRDSALKPSGTSEDLHLILHLNVLQLRFCFLARFSRGVWWSGNQEEERVEFRDVLEAKYEDGDLDFRVRCI